MEEPRWVLIQKFYGSVEAEVVRGLLEARGIRVLLSQEGAAKAIGISVGMLGETELRVPAGDEAEAREVVREFLGGELDEN